jgi:uncharacterized protein YutE (UPF0331/DUF86 family)
LISGSGEKESESRGAIAVTTLDRAQKESLIRRISFIEAELADLSEFANIDYLTYSSDRKSGRNIERILENVLNASIDIAKILMAREELELPGSYREVFLKLGEAKLLDANLAQNLADLTRVRNILSHQYLDIKWQTIKDFLDNGKQTVGAFLEIAKAKVEESETAMDPEK